MSPGRAAAGLAWAALTLGVSLGLAEAAIRLLGLLPEARGVFDAPAPDAEALAAGPALQFQLDPFLGWSSPELTREALRLAARRAAPETASGAGEAFVVGIFGGSVAGQLAARGAGALVEALGERFPERRSGLAVLNLALGAYKQPQQLFLLAELVALGVPFDLVVNIDGFNEVAFGDPDARGGHHPLLPSRLHFQPLLDSLRPAPSPAWLEAAAGVAREKRLAARLQGAVDGCAALRACALCRAVAGARVLHHRARAIALEDELQRLSADRPAGRGVAALEHPCLGQSDACWELIADIWERSSRMMHAISRETGAVYLHVLQPNQYLEGSKPLSAEERATAWIESPRNRSVREGYPHLLARAPALRAAGVAFHDLTGLFAGRTETLYADVCCHVNARGNALLAREIARLAPASPGDYGVVVPSQSPTRENVSGVRGAFTE